MWKGTGVSGQNADSQGSVHSLSLSQTSVTYNSTNLSPKHQTRIKQQHVLVVSFYYVVSRRHTVFNLNFPRLQKTDPN